MERKTSLLIGPRTRQNILKGKVVRKLEGGFDNFEDYWTASSDGESSTLSESSIRSSEMTNLEFSNSNNTSVHSPLKSKSVHSPLMSKAVHSPLKYKAVDSPQKFKRVLYNDTVNADGVVNVNKETSAIDIEDIPVNLGIDDNNPESEALNKVLANIGNKLPKVSSREIQEIHNANNFPLSCISNAAEFREIHSFNYSTLYCIYNKKSDLLVSKNSFKTSKKCISRSTKKDAKINELQLQYNEYDEKIMQMIHTNDKENERISNSSQEEMALTKENSYFIGERKEESKVKKQTVQFSRNIQSKENFVDYKYPNESIDRNSRSLNKNINDSESLSFENIQVKETEDTSNHKKNKFSKKNLNVDSSHIADILVNSYEVLSYFESDIDTGETQADKQAAVSKNSLPHNHINTHMNSPGSTSDVINSDTDSPSKNTRKKKHNNIEDLCYSESDIDTGETQVDKQAAVSKNSLPDNHINTHMNPPGNTSDVINSDKDSPSKNTRKSKNNNTEDLSYPESNIDTGETQANKQDAISKNYVQDNHLNTHRNSPGNTSDVINNDTDSPSKNTRKHNVQKTNIVADQQSCMPQLSYMNVMPQKYLPSSPDSNSFLKKSKLHKNYALFRSKVAVEINDSDNDNIDDISKSASEETSSNMSNNNISEICIIENEKTTTNNKTDFILDKNNLDATSFNESSHFQTVKRRKTFINKRSMSIPEENDVANTSVNFSEDSVNVSEVIMEKPVKQLKKSENDKNRQSETIRKSCFISHEHIIETADVNSSSERQTSTRRKTRNRSVSTENNVANTSMNFSEKPDSVSKINMEKTTKKQGKDKNGKMRQKETNKNSCFINHEDIVETADLDSYSQSQISWRRRARNSSITKENDFVNMPLNYSKNSVNFSDGINHKKTNNKNQRKKEKLKIRQKSASNKSDFISDKDIVENDELNLSQLQTSKNSSHHNYVNIEKTTIRQRKGKNSKSHDIQKTTDSSQQQTKRQKTSEKARNNFISEENDQADASINSSENCSVNNFSVITKKKTPKEQKKVESDKNRPLHVESDIENKSQSKVRASKKCKSNLTKNNINNENEESNHAPIRRSIRKRYAPFARWRNERLCYGFRDGNIVTFGVDKGTNEDNGYKNNQKQKIKKPKPIEIFDVAKNKKIRVHLHKKIPLIPWNSPLHCNTDENPSHAFLIKRMLETKKNYFGYIHINVDKTKQPQYIPVEDLLLTAVEGRVEIYLHDKVYVLERKDMLIVPKGTAYSITNISKKRALLSYVVGNFKFLDGF